MNARCKTCKTCTALAKDPSGRKIKSLIDKGDVIPRSVVSHYNGLVRKLTCAAQKHHYVVFLQRADEPEDFPLEFSRHLPTLHKLLTKMYDFSKDELKAMEVEGGYLTDDGETWRIAKCTCKDGKHEH